MLVVSFIECNPSAGLETGFRLDKKFNNGKPELVADGAGAALAGVVILPHVGPTLTPQRKQTR